MKSQQPSKLNAFHQYMVDNNLMSVDLGWRYFTIELRKDLYEGDDKCYGLTYTDKGLIILETEVDIETARETLIHEILHSICDLVGLDDEDHNKILNVTNEQIVTNVTKGLLFFMNLNRKMGAYLFNL